MTNKNVQLLHMKNLFIILFLSSSNLLIANDTFFESDFMDDPSSNSKGTIYSIASIRKTPNQLIIQINVSGSIKSTFRINRKTLRLSGNRYGICKVVGKNTTF